MTKKVIKNELVALVNQEPTLFTGTIRDNIKYGSSNDVTEAEIVEAARASSVQKQLSDGQKQRIAIARAVLKNPAISLLDETTSALDSHSKKAVQDALERLMTRRTSL